MDLGLSIGGCLWIVCARVCAWGLWGMRCVWAACAYLCVHACVFIVARMCVLFIWGTLPQCPVCSCVNASQGAFLIILTSFLRDAYLIQHFSGFVVSCMWILSLEVKTENELMVSSCHMNWTRSDITPRGRAALHLIYCMYLRCPGRVCFIFL